MSKSETATAPEPTPETKRDRVRRLLIGPLRENGFRFKHGTAPEAQQKALDRIADDLGYMSDRHLSVLAASLATKGEGSSRNFWPGYATIIGLAEAFQPRPLEGWPALVSWFGSAAGAQALAGNRLLAEFQFFQQKKRPPLSDQDRNAIAARAEDHQRQFELITDRERRGVMRDGDQRWLDWYERELACVEALVRGAQ